MGRQADDACASEVKVCLDRRTHGRTDLLFPKTATFQGDALLVYNSATFSSADFESIQQIGNSKKKGVWGKTGRFGIGFNSGAPRARLHAGTGARNLGRQPEPVLLPAVYHLTDLPSFVSGSKIVRPPARLRARCP